MGIAPTDRVHPAFPKSCRQDRDPKNVPHIERPHLHCPPRLPAQQAVVVAKRHALCLPAINAINDEQRSPPCGWRLCSPAEIAVHSTPSGRWDSHSWLSSCSFSSSGRSRNPRHYTVISSGAGRLFLPHSLLRTRRPAQREISLLFAFIACVIRPGARMHLTKLSGIPNILDIEK